MARVDSSKYGGQAEGAQREAEGARQHQHHQRVEALQLEQPQPAPGLRLAEFDQRGRAAAAEQDQADQDGHELADQEDHDDRADQARRCPSAPASRPPATPGRSPPACRWRRSVGSERTATSCSTRLNSIQTGPCQTPRRIATDEHGGGERQEEQQPVRAADDGRRPARPAARRGQGSSAPAILRARRSYAAHQHEGAHVAGLGQEIAAARAEQEVVREQFVGRLGCRDGAPRRRCRPAPWRCRSRRPTGCGWADRWRRPRPSTVPISMARRKSRLVFHFSSSSNRRSRRSSTAVATQCASPATCFCRTKMPPARSGRRAGRRRRRRFSR